MPAIDRSGPAIESDAFPQAIRTQNLITFYCPCGEVFLASLEHGRVPSPRPIASKEVPLVDRIEEMNVLKEAVYMAVHGEGGLVFIHGEAGIGKTRLLRELGAYARSHGVQVLYGRSIDKVLFLPSKIKTRRTTTASALHVC